MPKPNQQYPKGSPAITQETRTRLDRRFAEAGKFDNPKSIAFALQRALDDLRWEYRLDEK